jgi:flagellar FliL protein
MAKEVAAAEEAPKGGGKKKMLIIILAVVLVLVLAGGGAAVYLLTSKPAAEKQAGHEGANEEEHADEEHPPVYEKLEAFTVNLKGGESYLQVEVHLKVADAKVQEKLKQRMPEVRNDIIRILTSRSPEDLATQEGVDVLMADIQKQVNELLGAKKDSEGVKKVLFNAFIIQ